MPGTFPNGEKTQAPRGVEKWISFHLISSPPRLQRKQPPFKNPNTLLLGCVHACHPGCLLVPLLPAFQGDTPQFSRLPLRQTAEQQLPIKAAASPLARTPATITAPVISLSPSLASRGREGRRKGGRGWGQPTAIEEMGGIERWRPKGTACAGKHFFIHFSLSFFNFASCHYKGGKKK